MDSLDQELKFQANVFDMILFFASEEGIKPIPNSEKEILLEMSAAVAEYLGADTSKIIRPEQILICDHWWITLNKVITNALQQNSKTLDPFLVKALERLLTVSWDSDHGVTWWESGIRWKLMFRQRGMGDTFYLTVPTAQKVRENIEKFMSPNIVEHCKQIGILMPKYMARDLASR